MRPSDKHSERRTPPPLHRHSHPSWSPIFPFDRMERVKKRLFIFLLPVSTLFILFQHHWTLFSRGTFPFTSTTNLGLDVSPDETHGDVNSTLGFGAVVAVSHATSPRREGLLWAARLAGVDVVVPGQPVWMEGDVRAFKSREGSVISRGSALAWMGHLNALRWFLSTTLETALIIEDDIDFSLHLLPQATLASRALRTLLDLSVPSDFSTNPTNADPNFWAPASTWEILWLGHCSDDAPFQHILEYPSVTYPDPHLPPFDSITSPTSDLMRAFNLTDSRLVYKSYWPLCTFAYAVTRASAARILATYGTEGERGCVAYDVRMLEACRDHGWKCWTVAPELFHHVAGRSEIANINDGQFGSEELVGGQEGVRREKTVNIECGARDEWLWVERNDTEGRRLMMQKVREGTRDGGCF